MKWKFTEAEPHLWDQISGPYQVAGFYTQNGESRFNLIRFTGEDKEDFELVATGFLTLRSAQQFIKIKFKPCTAKPK